MSKLLDDYLKEIEGNLGETPEKERRAMLAEMRAHLTDDIERRRAEQPTLSEDEATLAAIHEFGDPAEIAARGGLLVPSPARRFHWRPFAYVILAFAIVFGIWATLAAVDSFMTSSPRSTRIYSWQNQFDGQSAAGNDSFLVPTDGGPVHFSMAIHAHQGCAGLRLIDPGGNIILDNGGGCGNDSRSLILHVGGTWTLEYHLRDFDGDLTVAAYTRP